MNREDKICDTPVTIGQVEDELKKTVPDGSTAKILEWEGVRIGVGKGFLSAVIKTKLKWNQPGLPTDLVLKIPTATAITDLMTDESVNEEDKKKKERFEAEMIPIAHDNESFVIKMLMDNKVPVPHPRFIFGPGGDGGRPRCMGVEDLSHGVMKDMLDGCSLGQARNLMEAVASLHAWSIQNKEVWVNKTTTFPRESIEQIFEDMAEKQIKELSNVNPEYFPKEKVDIATKYFNTKNIADLWTNSHGLDLGMPEMLIHGDVHTNNFFFKAGKDGQAADELLALLDWQTTRPGNFMDDVGRVTLFCLAPGLRRLNEKALVQHYYDCFASRFPKGEVPFNFDIVKKNYMRLFAFHGGMILAGVPVLFGPRSPFVANMGQEEKESFLKKWLGNAKEVLDDVVTLDAGGVLWD